MQLLVIREPICQLMLLNLKLHVGNHSVYLSLFVSYNEVLPIDLWPVCKYLNTRIVSIMHFVPLFLMCWRVCVKNNVLRGREGEIETEWMSSCGNISNIYSPPLSAVARAFEEQSNIRRWSEDSPFKPQGFIWERIPSVHRICSHFIWIHLFLRWKREKRGSEKK